MVLIWKHSVMLCNLHRYLKLLLRKEGLSLYTTAEFEVVKTMKERVCYLATNPQREESVDTERLQYQLPDGSTVEVSDKLLK